VLKLLSTTKIDDTRYGIYSHKLGNLWLTGGASNTGGAVLKHFFTPSQLTELSRQINPDIPTNLNYYPLLTKGDRFPLNNPNLEPKMTPRPDNPIEFLQGLLEAITNIETQGYQLLEKLGANKLTKVYTAGGGANNETWRYLRQKALRVDVLVSPHTQAAYGSALLAKK
jgi:sugar (pentulose or hexulose) kinase